MRLVIQRVKSASVVVTNMHSAKINEGLMCYVGFCSSDSDLDYEWAINKLSKLKILYLPLQNAQGIPQLVQVRF